MNPIWKAFCLIRALQKQKNPLLIYFRKRMCYRKKWRTFHLFKGKILDSFSVQKVKLRCVTKRQQFPLLGERWSDVASLIENKITAAICPSSVEAVWGPKTFSVSLNKKDYIISLADKKSSQDLQHFYQTSKTWRKTESTSPVTSKRSERSSFHFLSRLTEARGLLAEAQ